MSLGNYLVKSSTASEEIRSDFRPEEVEQLYSLLQAKGYDWYLAFVRNNQKDILRYISLSRSQRSQKKWINHPDGMLLRFAALQISETTLVFQRNIDEISQIVDHGSYRKFHSVLVNGLAPLLLEEPLKIFPFDDYESPF